MPADSPRIELYVNRSLPVTQKLGDYGIRQVSEYQDQFQWFQKQSLLSQIVFQGVSRPRRAAEFFKKANDEMEKDSWNSAHDYLKRALKLEPGHQEMLIDLAIVREKLSKHSQDSGPLDPQALFFKQANDEMEKENWSAARELLQRGLELEPDHKEMLIDLGIVEEKLGN
jgi:thioredoxin-like negative regulator of GroEL